MAGEDGSEGFSDLFQENTMLQRENDNLRMRVKAMQETIDHLNTRVTQLLTNEINLLLTKTGTRYPYTLFYPVLPPCRKQRSFLCDEQIVFVFFFRGN